MAYSCCFQKIEWPSLYAAARVTRSTYILPVDHGHAMWNAILMTSSVKSMSQHSNALEWKWNRQLTRPIFSVGVKKMRSGDETHSIWSLPVCKGGRYCDVQSQSVDRRKAHRGWCLTKHLKIFSCNASPRTGSRFIQKAVPANYYMLSDVPCMRQNIAGLVITYCKVGIFHRGIIFSIFAVE